MKSLFTILTVFMCFYLNAQTIVTFEDLNVPRDSFLNGENFSGSFTSGNAVFPSTYNAMFDFSSAWAVSSKRDSVTSGFLNQYSAKTAGGFNSSSNYAVSNGEEAKVRFTSRVKLEGFYVTNNTYAYNSVRDGDQFAKRFGGETGNDPDFLRLAVYKFLNGVRSTDSVTFYLADYRFVNKSQDYIIKNWTFVNLATLGEADSLFFRMASSDVGEFGINTPLYFCLDNLTTTPLTTDVKNLANVMDFKIFPNPTSDWVQVSWQGNEHGTIQLFDLNGKLIENQVIKSGSARFNLQLLPKGIYLLKIKMGEQFFTQKIMKH